MREALNPFVDPQGWLLFFAVFTLTVPNGGLGNFFHLILKEYGYNAFETILLGIPTGIVQVAVVIGGGYTARRYSGRRIQIGIFGVSKGPLAWDYLATVLRRSYA